jgi:hypothetical protein
VVFAAFYLLFDA